MSTSVNWDNEFVEGTTILVTCDCVPCETEPTIESLDDNVDVIGDIP
jgi:hypothetical protein